MVDLQGFLFRVQPGIQHASSYAIQQTMLQRRQAILLLAVAINLVGMHSKVDQLWVLLAYHRILGDRHILLWQTRLQLVQQPDFEGFC
jgi:hypothetical protein